MSSILKEKEVKFDDDVNEKVLVIDEENKNIEEVKDIENSEDKETDISAFIAKNKWKVYKEIADIYTDRSKNDNKLKEKYSIILIVILIIQLLGMNAIFILRGLNILNFDDTTFNIFITATIAEVFSLVTIIVKYLFTDNLTQLLSNILTEVKEDVDKK